LSVIGRFSLRLMTPFELSVTGYRNIRATV
jgi:hypothetical protein